jgi:hypothetical protein
MGLLQNQHIRISIYPYIHIHISASAMAGQWSIKHKHKALLALNTTKIKNDRAGTVSTVRPLYAPFHVHFGRKSAIVAAVAATTVEVRVEVEVALRPMVLGNVTAYDSDCSLRSNRLWGM